MYEQYRARCKAEPRLFNLGDAWLWRAVGQPAVFNLGTQERFWHARASYEAIEQALVKLREVADTEGIRSIAIPRIGVGYGGLSWKKVRVIIERVFADWAGRLVVYEEFVPAKAEREAEPRPAPDRHRTRCPRGSSSPRRTGK
jgi:O-acetyl-ADP-ribose deacetylase (regulator of RNase III)